jgi:hypothetical protein
LAGPPEERAPSAYAPGRIQKIAAMLHPDELMMSDIPWAVAWYGERPCAWLTLNDTAGFTELYKAKPVNAIYLTQQTTDRPFLSEILESQHTWEHFMFNSMPESEWPKAKLPDGFPLTKALLDYMPAQMFLCDRVRWKTAPEK